MQNELQLIHGAEMDHCHMNCIFNVSVLALPAKLRWLKKAKRTNKTSFFCLLSLMRMLSSDAVEDTQVKTVIAGVFSEEDGTPINVEQLKERNVSPEQRLFDNDIQNIISKQVPEGQKGAQRKISGGRRKS